MKEIQDRVRASAPGKLLLFGEYAVLAGGTAVVMAVDRRARVSIESVDSEDLHVVAPQLGLNGDGLLFDPDRADRALGLTGRLLAGRLVHHGVDAVGLRIVIDTADLFDRDTLGATVKLGLGSSAAVSAALDTALAAWAGHPISALDDLLIAYRLAVGGPVSGADLAASLTGGMITVRSTDDRLACESIEWPDGLLARPIWVGQPASTPAFASAFEGWRNRHADAAASWLARMDMVTGTVLEAGQAADWLAGAAHWRDGLLELQEALALEIVTEPHRKLIDAAEECGVVYKTCGAGGGDFGVALSDDPHRLAAFENRALDLGGRPVELAIDPAGASVVEGRTDPTEGA